jgi:hypothetical protein
MIYHMVLLKVRGDVAQTEVDAVFVKLALLREKIAGILSFGGGPYSSGEGMNKGYTHGFCMTFDSAEARDAYLPHPEHEVVKAHVLEILDAGPDGVVAFDFEA